MPRTRNPQSSAPPPCVGRAREIATIQSELDLALAGEGRFYQIRGEAGSGKSTLLRAFVSSLHDSDQPVVIAWGHCDQQIGKIRPLAPWTEILQSFSGMSDISVPEEQLRDGNSVIQTIRSTLTEFAPDIIELLIPGVGLVVKSAKFLKRSPLGERLSSTYSRPQAIDIAADRSQLQDQYVAIIERVLDQTPLIIVMDDLDCSDDASLQLLHRIVEKTRNRKILFLTALRPSRLGSGADSAIERICAVTETAGLDLDAVREARGQEFVAEYTDTVIPGVGNNFVQELCRHTGGHPLFVVELIEHLRRKGDIVRSNGRWQAAPDLGWSEVPAKIETILAAQLETLDPELLDILQAGSVEGDRFSIEIAAATLELSPVSVSRALARRAPRNLVVPLGSHPLGQARVTLFRFSHSLARQHLYAGINPLERVYLHRAVATQMEALAGEAAEGIAAQLAFQFEQAQVDDKAIRYYELAADLATSTCSLTEATAHLDRALEICSDRLDQMRLKHRLAKLQLMVGSARESARLCSEAATIAEQEGAPELGIILADQALSLLRINEFDSAWNIALRAEQLAREQGGDFGLLTALETLAHICDKRGHQQEALDYQAEAMPLAERLQDDNLVADSLKKWGWYLKELGRYEEAREALERSLAMQNTGHPNYSTLAVTYNALADLYISTENYPEARKCLLSAIENWRRFDRNSDVAVGLSNLANLANREGLFREALDYGRQAYREDVEVLGDDHPELAFSLSCIGESLIGLKHYDQAIDALKTAYELRQRHEAPTSNRAWTSWLLGRALVESGGEVRQGLQYVHAAREELTSLGAAARSEMNEIDSWLALHPG